MLALLELCVLPWDSIRSMLCPAVYSWSMRQYSCSRNRLSQIAVLEGVFVSVNLGRCSALGSSRRHNSEVDEGQKSTAGKALDQGRLFCFGGRCPILACCIQTCFPGPMVLLPQLLKRMGKTRRRVPPMKAAFAGTFMMHWLGAAFPSAKLRRKQLAVLGLPGLGLL